MAGFIDPRTWKWAVAIFAAIALFTIIIIISPSPPGEMIVVDPDPDGNGTNWTIGGDDVTAIVEVGTDHNKHGFTDVYSFQATLTNGHVVTQVDRLDASFGHCSRTLTQGCTTDTECAQAACPSCHPGETCQTTALVLLREYGSPEKFGWFLSTGTANPTKLTRKSAAHPNAAWRAELCGKLIGDITVSGRDSSGTPRRGTVNSDGCTIQAN